MKPIRRYRKSIKIQDVAEAAGVSISTVSRVLNNKDDVAEETLERVQSVIRELGYVSSLAARGMRSHHTNVIGLIMPDVISPYCLEIIQGVNHVIARYDYDLLIYTNGNVAKNNTIDQERHFVALLNGSITDGVIVVAGATTDFNTNAPVVIIDPNEEDPEFPAIVAANREGALEAMNYLTGLGHRRIGHITGRLELLSAQQRLEGYKSGLAAAGIPFCKELVQIGDYSIETSRNCALALLHLDEPPTAIIAANDMAAMAVYQAAEEAGLQIPKDLSVIGFDNLRESCHLNPPLTTVDQFIFDTGAIATEMIVKLLRGETLVQNVYRMKTQLVVRGSCQALV